MWLTMYIVALVIDGLTTNSLYTLFSYAEPYMLAIRHNKRVIKFVYCVRIQKVTPKLRHTVSAVSVV